MATLKTPYLLFLGDVPRTEDAKTATGIREWRAEHCTGQLRLPGCGADLGLPDMPLAQARAAGAQTLVIGVVNPGGVLPEHWLSCLHEALETGFDIASGLHRRLTDHADLKEAAARLGRQLHDVRHPTRTFAVGTGAPRPGKRLLTVGTDCAVGKMTTALALQRAMREAGRTAHFRATGQTGILIDGAGVSVDAVVSDFVSGAVEWLSPALPDDEWDIIEGQGSLFHPSFAGVSLGLLHGAQADALVMCHEPTRTHMRHLPDYPLPDIQECIDLNLACARLTNPNVRMAGVAVNTSGLDEARARACLAELEDRLSLPCVDPYRGGVDAIIRTL